MKIDPKLLDLDDFEDAVYDEIDEEQSKKKKKKLPNCKKRDPDESGNQRQSGDT